MKLFIKKAEESDIPAVHKITREAFAKYAANLGLPDRVTALKETPETIKRDLEKKTILVAYLDGRPVGSIRYQILPGNVAYISRFGVRPDSHNCGVGKALIREVEKMLKDTDVSTIALHSASKMTSLVIFYYKMGFYIHSTTTDRGYIRALFCKEIKERPKAKLDAVFNL